MNDKELKKLYTALINKGYSTDDLGDEKTFSLKMSDKANRKELYDWVSSKGNFRLGDYNSYENRLSSVDSEETQHKEMKQSQLPTTSQYELPNNKVLIDNPKLPKEPEYIEGFVPAFKQSSNTLWQGIKAFAGEVANIFTGSSRDEKDALNLIADLESKGIDINETSSYVDKDNSKGNEMLRSQLLNNPDKQIEFKQNLIRNGSTEEEADAILYNIVGEGYEHRKSLLRINDAIKEAGGDIDKAKRILEEESKDTWGDRMINEASSELAKTKPTKGFGAWVGELVPQMIGSASAIALSLFTRNPKYSNLIGIANMGGLTASTMGSSMVEARNNGASNLQTWAVGIADGSIEFITEKIPYDRYTKKLFNGTKKKVSKDIAEAVSNNDAAKNELAKLLVKANKKLGGKLLNGKNVKDYLIDIAAEGASEFTAEALQTITPMIYLEPEEYPTLSEIIENGWEGAKAGLFMGSVLGGASKIAEHRAEKKRRKEQGYVNVAEVNFNDDEISPFDDETDIVEIIGKSANNKINVLHNGVVKEIDASQIHQAYNFTFDEFYSAEIDMEQEESYNTGYNLHTSQEMNDAKNMYDYQRQRMISVVGTNEETLDGNFVDWLNEAKNAQNSNDFERANTIIDYLNAKQVYEGMIQRVRDDIDGRIEESNILIDKRTNKASGLLQGATLKRNDRNVFIVNGNVLRNEDGSIDLSNSDKSIIICDAETGYLEQISSDEISALDELIDLTTEKEINAEAIRQQFAGEAADKIDGVVAFNPGDTYPIADDNGVMQVQVVANEQGFVDNGDGTVNVSDGVNVFPLAKEIIQQQVDEANIARLAQFEEARTEFHHIQNEIEDDAQAYLEAVKKNTSVAYQEYLDNFPEGAYRDGARHGIWLLEGDPEAKQEKVNDAVRRAKDKYNAPLKDNTTQTAMERIPKDREGNPLYEQTDSDTAWDAIVEQTEGDVDMAQTVADGMVAKKEATLKKLEKAKSKGGETPAEMIAAEKERKAAIEVAKQELDVWKKIAGTANRRKIEAEAEQSRIAQMETERIKAEEEAMRAEREEAERLEREALNGVPDMVEDTPQDARARGYRRVNGHKIDRQKPVSGLRGKEVAVRFSDDAIANGRVAVIDAAQLQPSHIQGVRNPLHFIDEAQPKERNDEASVMSARKIAGNIRPEEITSSVTAYTGAPTVNARGEAIQGNNRSDALRLMWESHQDQAAQYKQYLIDHAEEFGLNVDDIATMERPVLVNMLDVNDAEAINLGQYVAQDTESGGTERIKPKNALQKMGADMRTFANMLLKSSDDDISFAGLIDNNGVEVLKWMNRKGYISPTQYRSAFDSKGNLTAEAKNDLRGIMYQSIFKNGSTRLEEMFNAMPAKAQKAILATAFRDYDSPNAERMIEEIQNSIRAFYALSHSEAFMSAKTFKDARSAVEAWKRQYQFDDVTGESYIPAENFSNFALLLATMYKGENQSFIQSTFNNLFDLIQGTQEPNLFEQPDNTPRTLAQAIKEVLNLYYNGQQRSNVLVGDNSASQRGQQGSTGDAATGERIESGERTADSAGSIDGDSGEGEINRDNLSLLDVVKTLYSKGKEVASKLFSMKFFDVAQTPKFMQELGLRGDKFTIKYGVIARHIGKDSSHTLTEKDWEQLPQALQNPFAISKITDKKDSYRIYTTLQTESGEYIVVGADVKNAGREIEVNSISTVFGRRNNANLPKNEEVIYRSKEITPDQSSLLKRPNFAQYPTEEELSESKDTTNSQTTNELEEKNNTPYSITPAQYTTKKGKVLDMHLVKFAGTLTKEQQRAAKELAKAEKGWYDREQGGFMMRSEESAKSLAGTILGNEEAVSDAQPVSLADTRKVVETEQPATIETANLNENRFIVNSAEDLKAAKGKTIVDKKRGVELEIGEFIDPRRVAIKWNGTVTQSLWEQLAKTINTEHWQIKEGTEQKQSKQGNNQGQFGLVSDERMAELKERLRKKLGGQLNVGIDPEILAIGLEIAVGHIDRGVKSFTNFAKVMIADLGDVVRPYLKAFYNGARDLPEVAENGLANEMTPYEEVQQFNVATFGKKNSNALTTAEIVVAEQTHNQEAEQAKQDIINQRNSERRKEDEQTSANTQTIASQTEAVVSEAESSIEKARTEQEVTETEQKVDKQLTSIDEQLNKLNYIDNLHSGMRVVTKDGKDVLLSIVMHHGEQLSATQFSKPRVHRLYGTHNGQMIDIAPADIDIDATIRLNEGAKQEATVTETESYNGFKRGDKVLYSPQGKNRETVEATIHDFEEYGDHKPVLDTGLAPVLYEIVEWSDIKPIERKEKKAEEGKKSKKKTVTLQKLNDAGLFDGLFENENNNDNGLQRDDAVRTERVSANGNRNASRGSRTANSEEVRQEGERTQRSGESGGERVSGTISQSDGRSDGRLQGLKKNTRNNHSERGKDHAPTSVDARIEANIKAIELAKELLESGEQATEKQMQTLRKFSGWGGLGKAFSEGTSYAPNNIAKKLRELLGEAAYQQAVMSANSAYYTPAYVVDTLWDIAEQMGFEGGNILEGSAGIGNILGQMPTHISEQSDIHAIEIDGTSGGILSLLYPDAKVDIQGFEETRIANGSVDLAITNVPFVTGLRVNDTTGDKDLSKKFHNIHDFCIAKNVRKLREGGLGIFITSSGTLDNSKKLRDWIVSEGGADFVGVFRMHNKTFGGTGVTSDIIVIRKRVNGKKSANAIDVSTVTGERVAEYETGETRKVKGQIVPIVKQLSMDYNQYFVEHPEMMAGEMHFGFEKGDTFRPASKGLYPKQGMNQEEMLANFVQSFTAEEFGEKTTDEIDVIDAMPDKKIGEVFVKDGKLYINAIGAAQPLDVNANKVKGHTKVECFEAYNAIKEALNDVLSYQTENESNEGLQPLLDKLNKAYDKFVATYGHFNKNSAIAFLRNDVDYANVASVETYEEIGDGKGGIKQIFGKADVMKERVVEKEIEPAPTNVKDGIVASIFKYGRIDVPYIAEHLNKSAEEIKKEIIESGYGFEDPATRQIEVSYLYLSGNVREKLRQAQENNENGVYDKNIKALQEVIPMDIPAHLIDFTLGSSWIEPKLYEEYVKERTEVGVQFTAVGGTWFMNEPYFTNYEKNRAMGVRSEMLGRTIMGHSLIEAAIQNKSITVSTTRKNWDGSTETITDKEATQACAAKIDEIRQDFKEWARQKMQSDTEMSERMERIYNDTFNNYVPMSIPDDFVPEYFGGASHKFKMRPHQGRAIVRGTMQPLLLAHEVGTGKTFTLISTAMEMRRLGTARKPMIVVQNATVGQFVESAKELYPNAKILTLEEADRSAEGRKNFYAKIKYNDWDMIVVPQSTFEFIPDSEERQMAFVQDKIEEKMLVLEQMKEADPDAKSMITRQAEREIELLEEQLAGLSEEASKKRSANEEKNRAVALQNAEVKALEMLDRRTDDVENFDDMGIDALLIDEAHEYKHLGFATAMQRGVKGVDPSYSKKSQGVFLKTQAVLEKNNGRNVIFATGTPISNTAAEIWTFMRYLMPADTMKEYGIYYFDDFVRNFGNIQQMLEFSTSGKFKENNRFAGYVNLPELVRIWSGVADTVLTKEAGGVKDKIPEMEGGKAEDLYLPQTRALRSIMKFVKAELERYDKMSGKQKKENSHIPLTMYGIAKAAAVDARLVQSDAEDDTNSKTNEAVRQTLRSLKETADYKGTVAIFADNYQNKESGFNLYEDIREKLIAEGVPADEIVVMKSGMTIKKKLEIFEKVNRGEVRVILGSTFTLGTGVNIQERLHTLIHLDAPNRPMDYTQRNGRILRQGNLHKAMGKPVRILRFGVEDSLDVTAYQRLKTKGAIADSIMNGKQMMSNSMTNRVLEEEEDVFGDTVAQLSGSEYAMLKNNAEKNVRKFASRKKQWEADQTYVHNAIPKVKGFIKDAEKRIEDNSRYLEAVRSEFPNGKAKEIVIGKHRFSSVEAMEDYLKEHNKAALDAMKQMREGNVASEQKRDLTIQIGNFNFVVTTKLTRQTVREGANLFNDVVRKMTYSCEALGLENVPVHQNLLRNAIEDITENVITGKDFAERIEVAERLKRHNEAELEQLLQREGKPFEYEKELVQAEEQFEEYAELMVKELAEKEAKYAEMDANIETADNIVNAEEDDELEREGDGAYTDDEVSFENDPIAKVLGKSRKTAKQRREFAQRERQRIVARVENLAKKLNLDNIEIVTDVRDLEGKKRRAKGFYSKSAKKITIVIPNHRDMLDVEQTLLHEAVAHFGLRQLFGEHFDTFLDNVYNNADKAIQERISELATKKGWDLRKATEEYLASLAENTEFENINASWWQQIKDLFLKMLHKIGFEGFSGVTLTDNELRYILWRSYENLKEPGRHRSILGEAADASKQHELKVGNYAIADTHSPAAAENDDDLFRDVEQTILVNGVFVPLLSSYIHRYMSWGANKNKAIEMAIGDLEIEAQYGNNKEEAQKALEIAKSITPEDIRLQKEDKSVDIDIDIDTPLTEEEQDIISEAKANGTYLKAPNGQDSNLPEGLWARVRTKAFKEWFGDWENDKENSSKVLDENGEPMVVYHGSKAEFYVFDSAKTATKRFFFTDNAEMGDTYDTAKPFFLNIRDAYEIEGEGRNWTNLEFNGETIATDSIVNRIVKENPNANIIFHNIFDYGFVSPGLIYEPHNVFVVTDPTNIKSTKNIGTFDNSNPDVRYREGNAIYFNDEEAYERMAERVEELANKLHLDNVEIVTDVRDLEGKKRRAKGFYSKSTGKITIVIPNHRDILDVEQSLLHEAVAHYGLRQLFGEEFETFLDNIYAKADKNIRERIVKLAAKNGWDFRKATEEYLASLAENTEFENCPKNWWNRIKEWFKKLLNKFGFSREVTLNDNSLRYILWRSYENLKKPANKRNTFDIANDIAKQYELRVGNFKDVSIEDVVKEYSKLFSGAKDLDIKNMYSYEDLYQFAIEYGETEDEAMRFAEDFSTNDAAAIFIGNTNKILIFAFKDIKIPYISIFHEHVHYAIEQLGGVDNVMTLSNELKELDEELVSEIREKYKTEDIDEETISYSLETALAGNAIEDLLSILSDAARVQANKLLKFTGYNKNKNYGKEIERYTKEGGESLLESVRTRTKRRIAEYAIRKGSLSEIHREEDESRSRSQGSKQISKDFQNQIEDDNLYRDGDPEMHERELARDRYERRVKSGMFQSQEALQDSMLGLKEAMQAILGKGSNIEDVDGFENAYLGENRLSSVNKAEADAFAHTLFKPMLDEVAKLARNEAEREELTDYMMAKHGLERNAYMRNEAINNGATDADQTDYAGLTALTGMDDVADAEAEAQRIVDDYEQAHDTTDLWNKINAVSKAILLKSYESGLMSKETFDDVSGMYEFYIPLRGFDEKTSAEAYAYLTHKDSAFNAPIKKARGRKSKADDPFANLQSMAESTIMQGNRNKLVKQRFLSFVLNHPSDLVSVSDLWLKYDDVTNEWKPVFPNNIDSNDTPEEVEQKMQEFEARMEQLAEEYPEGYKRGKDAVNIPYRVVEKSDMMQHQVVVKRGGRDYVITINGNPRAAQALNGQTNPDNDMSGAIGTILRAGEKVNRQLSAFYTTRNPDFIVSNFMRDMLYTNSMAWIKESPNYALRFHRNYAKVNPIKMKILFAKHRNGTLDMSNKTEAMFYQFMMNGGETGYANIRDIEKHKNDIKRELKKSNGKIPLRKAWDWLGERFDELNRAVENCARFAAFVTSREMGRSIDRAIYDAKEISVNFNKKGSGSKFLSSKGQTRLGNTSAFVSGIGRSGYVFWNAAIQGTTNFGRQMKRHPAKAFTGAAAMFLLGALVAYLGGDDDEDDKNAYYNLPEYVRRSNILFRAGDSWISIPLPIEYRAFYGMGELMTSVLSDKEHFTGGEIAEAVMGQATQILPIDFLEGGGGMNAFVPSVAKPLWEAYVAEKSWTGLPLYKDTPYNKDMPEWTKAYKSANKYLVNLSATLNEATGGDKYTKGAIDINPAKVEYMLNGYFGGVSGTIDKLTKTAETITGDREYDPRSILLWNRLVKAGDERTEYRAVNNEYFRLKEETDNTKRRLKAYEKDTDNGIFDFAEKIDFLYNSPEYERYEIFEDYRRDIDDLNDELKEANEYGDKEEVKLIETELNELKKEMIQEMEHTYK